MCVDRRIEWFARGLLVEQRPTSRSPGPGAPKPHSTLLHARRTEKSVRLIAGGQAIADADDARENRTASGCGCALPTRVTAAIAPALPPQAPPHAASVAIRARVTS